MITKTVSIKSTSTEQGKGDKTYLSVVLTDGKRENKYAIFDPGMQKTFQDAEKANSQVTVGLEKEGNYWNVKSCSPSGETKQEVKQAKYYKNDDDIMLQVALKAVVELDTHHIPPEGEKYDIGRIAQKTNELFASLLLMRPKKDA